jgi:hypothetical protein
VPAPDDGRAAPGQPRVAPLRRLVDRATLARLQSPDDGGWKAVEAAASQRRQRIGELGSGTVGPDPITDRSSPTTSEIASVSTGADVASARRPPLIADRCLRTPFNSSMVAPVRIRTSAVLALSSSVTPLAGTAISAEAPPDRRTSSVSPWRVEAASSRARRPARWLAGPGVG